MSASTLATAAAVVARALSVEALKGLKEVTSTPARPRPLSTDWNSVSDRPLTTFSVVKGDTTPLPAGAMNWPLGAFSVVRS